MGGNKGHFEIVLGTGLIGESGRMNNVTQILRCDRARVNEIARPQKQIYIESARGLAALMVVLTHFAVVFYPSAVDGSYYQAHEKWERLFWSTPLNIIIGGHFAVCLFFSLFRNVPVFFHWAG